MDHLHVGNIPSVHAARRAMEVPQFTLGKPSSALDNVFL